MSRIGKLPIAVPKGVKVSVTDGVVLVEGPKGKLQQEIRPEVELSITDSEVVINRLSDTKEGRSFHGLYRQLVQNMITGVTDGFSKRLQISGVGYRAEVKGDILTLNLGFTSPIEFMIPEDLSIACESPTVVVVSGIDKQRVGQFSADIRSLRKPEPYKGKGIKYDYEVIRRKAGKTGA